MVMVELFYKIKKGELESRVEDIKSEISNDSEFGKKYQTAALKLEFTATGYTLSPIPIEKSPLDNYINSDDDFSTSMLSRRKWLEK